MKRLNFLEKDQIKSEKLGENLSLGPYLLVFNPPLDSLIIFKYC